MSSDDINLPKDKCSTCGEMKVKVFKTYHSASYTKTDEKSGQDRKLVKRRKKYVDDADRMWHGKRCPDCYIGSRSTHGKSKTQAEIEELKKLLEE